MAYHILADLVLLLHASFVAFVVLGGLLALWKRWIIYLHLPALFWGAVVIAMGWICPLTPLENTLRRLANDASYRGGFIEHYLVAVIYPEGLTREIQIMLAVLLIIVNAGIYTAIYLRRPDRKKAKSQAVKER
jgi:hypothetical protein